MRLASDPPSLRYDAARTDDLRFGSLAAWLCQYEFANQFAEARFRLRCRDFVTADEHDLHYLLAQIALPFEDPTNPFITGQSRTRSCHLRQFRASGRRARHTIFRQTIERMRNPLSPIFGSIRTKFEITKRQGKRVGGRIGAHSVVCHLLPAVRGQTDIGVMLARARNARTSRVPTKNEQCAVDESRPFDSTGTVFRFSSGNIPGGFIPVIVMESVTQV